MAEAKITKKDLSIGKRIRRFRRNTGLTQEQLADRIHISTTHVGLVEVGRRRMSLKTMQKVAKALGVKVRDLIPF